jgi:hypothetical protein
VKATTRLRTAGSLLVPMALAFTVGPACARHVNLEPRLVARMHQGAWTIRRPPAATPASEEPATKTPPARGGISLFRSRPEVVAALRTAPDSHGVPSGLYALDPLLRAHQEEVVSRASRRRSAGAGLIVLGLVEIGLGGLMYALGQEASSNAEKQRQAGATKVNDPSAMAYVWGVVSAALGAATTGVGIGMLARGSDPELLTRHYRETYQLTR